MPKCSQCSTNDAMVLVMGHQLCLHCYSLLHHIQQQKQDQLQLMINFLTDNMSYVAGVSDRVPRFPERRAALVHAPVRLNHINIDRSVVGSVNTGDAVQIDVSLRCLDMAGHQQMTEALKEFTNQLLAGQALGQTQINEVLEQLRCITQELAAGRAKKSVLGPLIQNIGTTVSAISALAVTFPL